MTSAASVRGSISTNIHSSDTGLLFFAFHVRRFLTLSALGVEDRPPYHDDFRRRQVDLITSLTNRGDEGRTYEFRLISHPDPQVPARGHLNAYVICRVDDASLQKAEQYASEFSRTLKSSFLEYEFDAVESSELEGVLNPFAVQHALGIRRRVGFAQLDTVRPGPDRALGIGRTSGQTQEAIALGAVPPGCVLHIYPFLPTRAPFNNLFRLLLVEPQPCALSVRIQPTTLNAAETSFLEHSLTVCERHGQISLGSTHSDDLTDLFPTLREKAHAHAGYLSRLLFGLRDNAALMTVTITSAAPISPFVAEAFGSVITEPAGGIRPEIERGFSPYLAGGYDVFPVDSAVAESAMHALNVLSPEQPLVPANAHRLPYLFDSSEAATSILLPPITSEPLPGVDIRGWKPAAAPRSLPETGVLLGETVEAGTSRSVRIAPEDRLRHVYTVGQTGTGKSTLLRTMILDDIRSGAGVCVLDPHGDLYKDLLEHIPSNRIDDVILIDPTDTNYPVGLNLLEVQEESQRHFVVQELTAIIAKMLRDSYGDYVGNMTGPLFYQHVRMNLLLVMSDPSRPGTLMDFYRIFQEKNYWEKWAPPRISDPMLDDWVNKTLPNVDYTRQTSDGPQFGGYMSSKFESFLFDPMLRGMFSQSRSTVNFRSAMDTGKIVLVNLAKGELSEPNSSFLGMVILAMIQSAAVGRSRVARADRRPFYIYVDEFQSVATESFVTIVSEGRKFGLGLTLANQFVSQIRNETIMDAIFGNVGTLICFRLGESDAERLEKEMAPTLNRHDLLDIPNWHAYISALVHNQTVRPFEMRTVVDETPATAGRAAEVRDRSRARYGRSRPQVADSPNEPQGQIEDPAIMAISKADKSGRGSPTLFDGLADSELVAFGVPAEHVSAVREATVSTILDVVGVLPQGMGAKLLELAARLASKERRKKALRDMGI